MKTENSPNYLREIIFIIFVQKRLIFWTTTCLFVISVLIAFYWPPTYSATGSILLRGKKLEKSPEALEQMDMRSTEVTREDLVTEMEVLRSPDLIRKTIYALKAKNLYPLQNKGLLMNEEIHNIRKSSLITEITPTSNVIEILYFNKNRDYAVHFLQALMEQYLENRLKIYHPQQTETFYSNQAGKFKNELLDKEDELMTIAENSLSADPVLELEKNMGIKATLEQNLIILKADAVDIRQVIEQLDRVLLDKGINFFSFIDNKLIISMSTDLQQSLKERGNLLRIYRKESEEIKLIDNQIKDIYSLLRHEVDLFRTNEIKKSEVITTKIKILEDKINKITSTNVELKKQAIQQKAIDREITLNESSYDIFAKRKEEAETTITGKAPSLVSILNRAFPSKGVEYPKKRVVIPLGLAIGFLFGFSLGFLRHYFDHTFKKPADVENVTGLNVIFSIPLMKESKTKY